MTNNRQPKLTATVIKRYRTHWALFWRIVLPVAIIAIGLNVVQNLYLGTLIEKDIGDMTPSYPNGRVSVPVSRISTTDGIHPTVAIPNRDLTTNVRSAFRTTWQLLPIPAFRVTNNRGMTWEWELRFQSFYSMHLFLLLLTLCPLSLAVARISHRSGIDDNPTEAAPLTAREMWRQTGRKAFKVFATFLLFMLLVDVVVNLHALISWLMSLLNWRSETNLIFSAHLIFPLIVVSHIYLFVMLSLYNPCLILENNSIVGIFRRSYALVSGARLRFFGIYLLTGWIALIITSVLLGIALLALSVFVPTLTPVREALFPLQFLTLFIGFNIQVELSQLLGAPATVAILIIKGLITTAIIPIWAIVTTHLYFERVSDVKEIS